MDDRFHEVIKKGKTWLILFDVEKIVDARKKVLMNWKVIRRTEAKG